MRLCEFVLTVWDLCFVTDYVLQFGEVAPKKKYVIIIITLSAQITKRGTGKLRMGKSHWVTDIASTTQQCFSPFDEMMPLL